jgi:hypothetical protein
MTFRSVDEETRQIEQTAGSGDAAQQVPDSALILQIFEQSTFAP